MLLPTKDSTTAGGSRSVISLGPVVLETKQAPTTRSLQSVHPPPELMPLPATTTAKSMSMEDTVVSTTRELLTATFIRSTLKPKLGRNTTQL